jgi:protein-L-isoaspartate(D-aspartate) O-methyltransferase
VALDEDRDMLTKAQAEWDAQSCSNVVAVIGPLSEGAPKNAPYDLIIFNGAVCNVPDEIKSQMSVGGRMIALIKKSGQNIAKATLIEHVKEGVFSDRVLFDAGTPYLPAFAPKKEFVF